MPTSSLSQRCAYFLIFPRAEADLQACWKGTPSPLQASLSPSEQASAVRWMAAQCLGLADGLRHIHRYRSSHARLHPLDLGHDDMYGHHGDIKPENVLWFADWPDQTSPGNGGGLGGTPKLSDFGLARFSPHRTMSRYPDGRAAAITRTYAAPECDLPGPGGEGVKGRQFNMWTLGCLYLEFVTWLVSGWEGVQHLKEVRESVDVFMFRARTDTFFTLRKDARMGPYAIVKPTVTEFIHGIRASKECTPYVDDFLNLIQDGLLAVNETKSSNLAEIKGGTASSRRMRS